MGRCFLGRAAPSYYHVIAREAKHLASLVHALAAEIASSRYSQ